MYEGHFGFRHAPFGVTPDLRFLFRTPRYEEALATVLYGIRERKGFMLLTGEVGTGKTTLLHAVIAELGDMPFVFVFNSVADFDQLLTLICDELGLTPSRNDRPARLSVLNRFLIEALEAGRTTVLLLDEAQNLSAQTLEDLRQLSNLETPTEKLLQIVLVGQPELAARLADPSLRQLRQRIALRYELKPLSTSEVGDFVRHRLLTAGAADESVIAKSAVSQIARLSGGIPRLINQICDSALLVCYGASQERVTPAIVDEVAQDLGIGTAASPAFRSLDQALQQVERFAAGQPMAAETAERAAKRVFRIPFVWISALVLTGAISVAISAQNPDSRMSAWIEAGRRISDDMIAAVSSDLPSPKLADLKVPDVADAVALVLTPVPAPLAMEKMKITDPQSWVSARVTVFVKFRSTLLEIVGSAYGSYCRIALDLVPAANPGLVELDVIEPGQPLALPPIEPSTLVRQAADGTRRMIVGAYFRREMAARVARAFSRRSGLGVETTLRRPPPHPPLYRVEATGLHNVSEVALAWSVARKMDLVPIHPEAFGIEAFGGVASRNTCGDPVGEAS